MTRDDGRPSDPLPDRGPPRHDARADGGASADDGQAAERGVDPITLEVLRSACSAVAEEMNATLVRTAYSPNVTDRRDCSCALFDPSGAMISQAENVPVHLGAMPFSVRSALEEHPPETLAPGDAVAVNDPYRGGAHLPDVTLVTPVFADEDGALAPDDAVGTAASDGTAASERGTDRSGAEGDADLVAIVANRAHHADVGGATAGSVGADATEIYAEGLRLPPVKLVDRGSFDRDLLSVVLANVRTPDERRGDLRAQAAANAVGRERVGELVAEHGRDGFADAVAAIQDYSERRVRAAVADLPDGEYRFADVLEDDGRGAEDLRIEATVTVDGDDLAVDFAGSSPQTASPLNAVRAVTVSATYFAVRCVTDPDVPPNAGAYRPIDVRTPSGTVVDAEPPAAVVGGNLEVSQRVADVVFGALADAAPERAVAAGQGTMNNVTLGGSSGSGGGSVGRSADRNGDSTADRSATDAGAPDANGACASGRSADRTADRSATDSRAPDANGADATDRTADRNGDSTADRTADRSATDAGAPDANGADAPFAFYETQGGGSGARSGADGMDAVHVHMTNTRNTSAEVLQTSYPLAVERYELRPDSAGAGEFRGGLGLRRDLRVRADGVTLSLLGERRRRAPYGIEGGESGATGADVLLRGGPGDASEADRDVVDLPSKCTRVLDAGDVVSVRTPGGGGYGDPADRDAAAVRRDVRLGKCSAERARRVYGVDVDED